MRLGQAIFFGSAAALLTLAAPTLARNSSPAQPPKATGTMSSCDAYPQAADGLQTELSCQESARAQPSRSADEGKAEEAR
jgi:hypothetical protein